jgi:exonuclease III
MRYKCDKLLNELLLPHNIDICLLQETKMDAAIPSPSIPGYVLLRRDRTANGGGVGIVVRDTIKHMALSMSTHLETVAIRVPLAGGRALIAVSVYRSPSTHNRPGLTALTPEQFVEELHEFIASIFYSSCDLLLGGDMNLDAAARVTVDTSRH